MYADQIKPGQKYNVFKKCVSISILDFILFEGENDFYSCFHILEDTRHFKYTDKMEFHVIELPKLPAALKENSSRVELWAKFINAEETEEFNMIAKKDPYIKSAYDQLQRISQDEQKRLEYEAREKAILDYNQGMFEAEQRGEKRGEQRGEQRGIRNTARNLFSLGVDIHVIAEATHLSIAEIEALKKEIISDKLL